MKKIPFIGICLLPIMVMVVMSSCKKESSTATEQESASVASLNKSASAMSELLKSVRNSTSRYHSTKQAIAAGYEPDDHCVSVPGLGGMGYHWVNQNLVDPVFDPLQPEVVLYAKGPGGNLRMVAVEYIVLNMGQPAPMFGTQAFMNGGTPVPLPHWSLHVWLYEENPNGMFTPFNPNVSCP